jgi:hypothetical protein
MTATCAGGATRPPGRSKDEYRRAQPEGFSVGARAQRVVQ